MFTTDEAHKIGLVDELATDKADAVERCEKFLLKFAKISPNARALTKQIFRGEDLADLAKNREADVQWFLTACGDPKVQKSLELYLESMKKKKWAFMHGSQAISEWMLSFWVEEGFVLFLGVKQCTHCVRFILDGNKEWNKQIF